MASNTKNSDTKCPTCDYTCDLPWKLKQHFTRNSTCKMTSEDIKKYFQDINKEKMEDNTQQTKYGCINCSKIFTRKDEMKVKASNISKSYSEIKNKVPPRLVCSILSEEFERFYSSIKKKSNEDKCIAFQLFRLQCHSMIYRKYFRKDNKLFYSKQKNLLFFYFPVIFL